MSGGQGIDGGLMVGFVTGRGRMIVGEGEEWLERDREERLCEWRENGV